MFPQAIIVCALLLAPGSLSREPAAKALPFSPDEVVSQVTGGGELSGRARPILGPWENPSTVLLEELMIDTVPFYVGAPEFQWFPSVGFNGINYLVVWQDSRVWPSDIYGARVDASGVLLDSIGIPISTAPGWQTSPSVTSDGANYLVVWGDSRNGDGRDIYGARIGQSGILLDTAGVAVSTAPDHQTRPSAAFHGANYVVVWTDGRSGTDMDIYGTRVDTSGNVLDTSGVVVSSAVDDQQSPSIAFAADAALVVWEDWRNGTDSDIYGARVAPSGSVLDTMGIAISTGSGNQGYPSVASDGINRHLVVWQDGLSGLRDIRGARLDTAGIVLDSFGIAICSASDDQSSPCVAFDGTDYIVVWQDGRPGLPDIFATKVDTSGIVADTLGTTVSGAAGSQTGPSVVCSGVYCLIAWGDNRTHNDWNVRGARIDTSGILLDTLGILLSTAANYQMQVAASFDGTNYFVVWEDYRTGDDLDIFGMRVSPSGVVLDSSAIAISTVIGDQKGSSVAFDGMNYLAVWYDFRDGSSGDVYGARVDQSGVVLDPASIPISVGGHRERYPAAAFGGTNYLVVWVDSRNISSYDIYGSRVGTSGTVLDPAGIPISVGNGDKWSPFVVFSDTHYFVVWSEDGGGSGLDIYGARVDTSGVVLDIAAVPICTAERDQTWPSAAFDGNNYLVIWEDEPPWPMEDNLRGARVNQSGEVLDTLGFPICTTDSAVWFTSAAFDGSNYIVVWGDHRGGNKWGIYGARVDTSGTVLDPSGIVLVSRPHSRRIPTITNGPDDQCIIVYEGFSAQTHNSWRVFGALYPTVGVDETRSKPRMRSSGLELRQNVPNPFRSRTAIRYQVAVTTQVSLKVYDTSGRVVGVLVDEKKAAGTHSVRWDGRDSAGEQLPSGIYFCRLQAGDATATRKMILVR